MGDGLRVGLLGPTVVERDGVGAAVPGAPQRAVLARLALSPGRTVPDDDLVDVLWPTGAPDNAMGNLQSYVSRLRRVVGAAVVARDTIGYRLDLPPEAVDVGRFDTLIARAEAADDAPAAVALFAEALALWRGEPFCDLPDPQALGPDRARLAALHRRAVEGWLAARSAAGEGAALLPDLERAAAEDPTAEAVHLLLMAVLHQVGRSPDALRVGAGLRERIIDATGLDPSSALGDLERRILADDPSLRPESPAARPRTAPRRGPRLAPADRFVGRVAELEALGSALASHQIVSVVGPGGAGKTRLVQELIDRGGLTPAIVDLAPVEDEADVLARAAAALGVQGSTEDIDAVLGDVVAGRAVTLVLHSCEHVLDAARALAERFLGAGPDVAVLATSRVRLGLPGEKVVRLAGLGPDEQVELFRDRATLLRGDFVMSDEVEAQVRSIGRKLDGLPLALELAAGREAVFGLAQLDAQLAEALHVVTPVGGGKDVTSAVEWSYGLLSPAARDLFDRLSVAPGGAVLEALDHLAPDGLGRATVALGELVEASLVDVDLGADPPRYRALEVVRRVGLDHLDPDLRSDARRRLRAWMTDHVARAEQHQVSRSPLSTALFRRELANLTGALVVEEEADRVGIGPLVASVAALVYDDPQIEVLERLRALAPAPGDWTEDDALCGLAAGMAAWIEGETDVAERLLDAAMAVLPPGHPRRWSATFAAMPNAMFTGDVEGVERMASDLRADPAVPVWAVAVGIGCAALMRLYTGDRAAAEAWLESEADVLERGARMDGFVAFTHGEMAAETDPDAAVEWYAQSALLSDAMGTTYTREVAHLGRAAVLVRQGRTAEAARACSEVVRACARVGMWPQVWTTLRFTAELLVATGHEALALTALTAAEHDPKASTVMGPELERQAALRSAIEAALTPEALIDARAHGRTVTRAALVEEVVATLATLA